ncbi:MAG: hypothetical protein A2Y71_06170 [Bacteroidetes bacterium RBG_13_42_15]|nr:MAG: hypothetical protein A2Y71_06170 [Bacteroidetes bacterium RBG_13_42_15]
MANRTTAAEVLAIMDNCSVSSDDITTHYITAANALVTSILGDDTDIGSTLLEEIERWLTAHLIAVSRWRSTQTEKVGEVSVKYTGFFGKMLESTPYGQMVLTLDTTGKMARSGKGRASIYGVKSFD